MKNIYTPDYWVIVKLTSDLPQAVNHFRILAGWSGSYLYGSSWKLSSGIETFVKVQKTPEDNDTLFGYTDGYRSLQTSGSVYVLHAGSEGMNSIMHSTLSGLQEQNQEQMLIEQIKIEDFLLVWKEFCTKRESF
jgi:hypothetical protein